MPRKYDKRPFNDQGLNDLYESDPGREWTQQEIAEAAGVPARRSGRSNGGHYGNLTTSYSGAG